MKEVKKKTAEIRTDRRLKRNLKAKSKFKALDGLKEKLLQKNKPIQKVQDRFKGINKKRRNMKKILGIGDDSTMDLESSAKGDFNYGDADYIDEDILRKRSKSRLRAIARNRSTSQKPELNELEKVIGMTKN